MAFNKAKSLSEAKRLIDKGQFRKAIPHYERLVEGEPEDRKVRLRLADLYHKAGDLPAALKSFFDVARHYSDEGFLLKSVAIYKQMLRIDSGLHPVHIELARVYQQLGLVNDAISQYQEAIRVLGARGRNVERLNVIRELLELDPDNIRGRVRLAEDFAAEGHIPDAVRELRLAAETLDREGRFEEFTLVAERLLHHQPEDAIISRRLAELYLEQNDPQRALPRLQACFRSHPTDVEVLEMLSQAFQMLGQSHKALTVLRELARIHDRNGLSTERDRVLEAILSIDPRDADAESALLASAGRPSEPPEFGFDEIAFDELEDADVAPRTPSPLRRRSVETTPEPSAGFGDLDALVELVASEPVSSASIQVDEPPAMRSLTPPPSVKEPTPQPLPPEPPPLPPPLPPPPPPLPATPPAATPPPAPVASKEADEDAEWRFNTVNVPAVSARDLAEPLDETAVEMVEEGGDDSGWLSPPPRVSPEAPPPVPEPPSELELDFVPEPEPEPEPEGLFELETEEEAAPVPPELAGELREFDFYLRNGLADAAGAVLDDLAPELQSHPEVVKRRKSLLR